MPMDRLEHGHQAGVIEVCAYRDLRLKNMADMGHFFHSFINFIFLCRADSSKNDPYDPYLFQLRASFQHFMDERMLHKSAHVINCGQELVVIYSNINSGLRPIFLVGTALPLASLTHNGILKRPGAFPKYPPFTTVPLGGGRPHITLGYFLSLRRPSQLDPAFSKPKE